MLIKISCAGDKMRYILAAILLNMAVFTSGTINYCGSKMCGHTNDHTYCMYPLDVPGVHCAGYIDAPLTPREKTELLHRLNTRRNAAASGRLRGFPPAGNMLKLHWVGELEREAQIWANQCVMPNVPEEHDICRELYATSVGQCVASVVGEAPGLRPETMVDIWYMQSINYKGDINDYRSPRDNVSYYGDFAQMLYHKTFMVGCARSKFMAKLQGRFRSVERLVCNFAPQGPYQGRPIWIQSRPGALCPPRAIQDDLYPALCDYQSYLDESQDQDHLMTLEDHLLLDSLFAIEKNESLNYPSSLDEIYLTKLAVATLANTDGQENINSIQKRDVPDITSTRKEIDEQSIEPITVSVNEGVTVKNKLYKDPDIVGRPKSYNIEELNLNNGVTDETSYSGSVYKSGVNSNSKDLYVDYIYEENVEENTTSSVIGTLTTPLTTHIPTIIISLSDNLLTNLFPKVTEDHITTTSTIPTESTAMSYIRLLANLNENMNETDQIIDELLADPEMAQRIHDELDRLERLSSLSTETPLTNPPITESSSVEQTSQPITESSSTSSSSTSTVAKVRRDLREREEEQETPNKNYENVTAPSPNIEKHNESTHSPNYNVTEPLEYTRVVRQGFASEAEALNNITAERAPMLNMVMKYLPYLRTYETSFVRSTTDRSYVLCPTFVLVLLLSNSVIFNL